MNIELNFPPKLRGARSRLYRRRFLQVNTRWKALAEIYTMHSFALFSNLHIFVKNRQNFFAIEYLNFAKDVGLKSLDFWLILSLSQLSLKIHSSSHRSPYDYRPC